MCCARRFSTTSRKGFTLAEAAIVVVIMGLVMLAVLPTMTIIRSGQQRAATDQNLAALLRAAATYVQANGCLPCPSPASSTGTALGRVRGDTTASPAACGTCTQAEGIAPFVSLGISPQQARDGWGRWMSMRIDPLLAQNPIPPATTTVTPPALLCTAGDASLGCTAANVGVSAKGLCRANLNKTNAIQIRQAGGSTQNAAIVFVSHGKNGRGAFYADVLYNDINGSRAAFPPGTPTCGTNAGYERCNADGNAEFVVANATASDSDPYDDQLVYADRNTIVSTFGNGSCQTAW